MKAELENGNITLIDIREPAELEQNGMIAGRQTWAQCAPGPSLHSIAVF